MTRCVQGTEPRDKLVADTLNWLTDYSASGPWSDRHRVAPLPVDTTPAALQERTRLQADLVHQADLALRRKVGQAMVSATDKHAAAQQFAAIRSQALHAVRSLCHSQAPMLDPEDNEGHLSTSDVLHSLVDYAWKDACKRAGYD